MATVHGNKITGIGTVPSSSSPVNKFYMDNKYYPSPNITNVGNVLSRSYLSGWTLRTAVSGTTILNVVKAVPGFNGNYIGHYFIASTNYSLRFSYSTDGLTWQLRTAGNSVNNNITRFLGGNNIFVYTTAGLNAYVNSSTDSIVWTQSYSTETVNDNINAANFANGQFLVFSKFHGYTSTDAIVWSLRTVGVASSLNSEIRSSTFSPTQYLIGGNGTNTDAFIGASTDTIHWSLRTIPAFLNTITSITIKSLSFGNDLYVAGGDNGYIITSTDSIRWTRRTAPVQTDSIRPNFSEFYFKNIEYIEDKFFAVGESIGGFGGVILTSTNGIVWTKTFSDSNNNSTTIRDITYHPIHKRIVACGGGTHIITTDYGKIDWTRPKGMIEYTTPGNYIFNQAVDAQFMYLELVGAGAGGGAGTPTPATPSLASNYIHPGIGGNGGTYVSALLNRGEFVGLETGGNLNVTVGRGGLGGNLRGLATSTNGIVWIQRAVHNPSNTVGGFIKFGNVYAIAGTSNFIAVSTNAINWVLRSSTFNNYSDLSKTVPIQGTSFAYGSGAQGVLTSTDLINWAMQTTGITPPAVLVPESSRIALAADSSTTVRVVASTNGTVWTFRTIGTTSAGLSIGYKEYGSLYGLYSLTLNSPAGLAVSTDTISWSLRTIGTTSGARVIYGRKNYPDNYYLLGTNDGSIMASTDTIHWLFRTTPLKIVSTNDRFVQSIDYGPIGGVEQFVAYQNASASVTTDNDGSVLISSTDTFHWVLRSGLGKASNFNKIRYLEEDNLWIHIGQTFQKGLDGQSSRVSFFINSPDADYVNAHSFIAAGGLAAGAGSTSPISSLTPSFNVAPPAYGVVGGISSSAPLLPTSGNVHPNGLESTTRKRQKFQPTAGGTGAYMSANGANVVSSVYGREVICQGGLSTTSSLIHGSNGIGSTLFSNFATGGGGGGAVSIGYCSWYLRTTAINAGNAGYGASLIVNPSGPLYLKAAGTNSLSSSTDTIHWNPGGIPSTTPNGNLTCGFWSPVANIYLYGNDQGQILSSTNAAHWTLRSSGLGTLQRIDKIGYSYNLGQHWLLTNTYTRSFIKSTNGIDWSTINLSTFPFNGFMVGVAEKPSTGFVLAAEEGNGSFIPKVAVTSNFDTWIQRTVPLTTSSSLTNVKYDSNFDLYYAMGNGRLFMVSTDTIVWSHRTTSSSYFTSNSSTAANYLDSISLNTVDGLRVFIVDGNGQGNHFGSIRSSTDTIHWSNVDTRRYDPSGSINYSRNGANGRRFVWYPGSQYLLLDRDDISIWAADVSQRVSIGGNGGHGSVGCGGGGGGYSFESGEFGLGGDGGDGLVRITWW